MLIEAITLYGATLQATGPNQNLAWRALRVSVNGTGAVSHIHNADPCVAISLQKLTNDGRGANACVTATTATKGRPAGTDRLGDMVN
jgi:hypothetical protein